MVISRTATSPAGETIEIVSDDDWIKTTDCNPKGLRTWNLGSKKYAIAVRTMRVLKMQSIYC